MSAAMRDRAALTALCLAKYVERGFTVKIRRRDAIVTLAVARPGEPIRYFDGGTLDACVAQLPELAPIPRRPRIVAPALDHERAAAITDEKRRFLGRRRMIPHPAVPVRRPSDAATEGLR